MILPFLVRVRLDRLCPGEVWTEGMDCVPSAVMQVAGKAIAKGHRNVEKYVSLVPHETMGERGE